MPAHTAVSRPPRFNLKRAAAACSLISAAVLLAGCVTTGSNQPATQRGAFGVTKDKVESSGLDNIKTERKVIVGTFRVAFTQSVSASARSSALFSTNTSSAAMSGKLTGLSTADYQAITDQAYADFLAKLKATGLEVVEVSRLQSASYAGMKTAASPQKLDADAGELLMLAPTGVKLALFPGETGVSSAFAGLDASNPMRVLPGLAKEQQAGVISVTYYIDFMNAETSGNTMVLGGDAEVSMGQGLSVRPGSGIQYNTLKGSQCVGYCPDVVSKITLGQSVYSTQAYGKSRDVTAGGVNTMGVISGLLSGNSFSRKDLEIDANPALYRDISTTLLGDANKELIAVIQAARK